jgi:hypothetical protein
VEDGRVQLPGIVDGNMCTDEACDDGCKKKSLSLLLVSDKKHTDEAENRGKSEPFEAIFENGKLMTQSGHPAYPHKYPKTMPVHDTRYIAQEAPSLVIPHAHISTHMVMIKAYGYSQNPGP